MDLLGGQSFVSPIILLDQVWLDDGRGGKTGNLARLARTLHRTTENESRRLFRYHPPRGKRPV